jgi:hypothetical protein
MQRLQETVYIYALFDPLRPDVVRYVGKTYMKIETRRMRHVGEARRGLKNHRGYWIRALLADGVIPVVRLLAEVPANGWQAHEKRFIAEYRETLVNSTDGGEGLENPSEETRRKMSEKNKGRPTPNHVRKLRSENAKVRKWDDETKRKISESKKRENLSEETRRKRSEANRRRTLSPETRAKIASSKRAYHERRRAAGTA